MFDHVVFGVSDYEASKAFFLKALAPLGIAVVQERPGVSSSVRTARFPCACCKARKGLRISTWRSAPSIASKCRLSIGRI